MLLPCCGSACSFTQIPHLPFLPVFPSLFPKCPPSPTGYSITRSLTEAPHYATALAAALRSPSRTSLEAATQAWDHLWSAERKRQQSFMIFGLELILQLDAPATRDFFNAFFKLPPSYPSRPFPTTPLLPSPFSALLCSSPTLSTHLHPSPPLRLWRGFLASNLSSLDLLLLAFSTFLVASNPLRFRLINHLIADPSGANLIRTYAGITNLTFSPLSTPLRPSPPLSAPLHHFPP
ncbi:unnamed protein product [Closterium sp. NIES-65]|nr:unnamed protein product [Closterium sp. NIES-65]